MNKEAIELLMQNPAETRILLTSSFKRFVQFFHFRMYKTEFIFKEFHERIINAFEDIVFNKPRNLIINISPRFGKSRLCEYFIAWTYAVNKNCNNIYTSYSDELVRKFSGEIKALVEDEYYRTLFFRKIRRDSNNKALWKVDDGGEMRATSLGGSLTGFGAGSSSGTDYGGCIVLDDPLKADDARRQNAKEHCLEYFQSTLLTRRNSNNTPIIIIMQRLAVDDIVGWIKENCPDDYEFIEVKARGEDGKSVWEERISTERLNRLEKENPSLFFAQYQQEPIVAGGNLFKKDMFIVDTMPKFDYTFVVADTAYKDSQENDYTCFMWCGVHNGELYIIDIFRDKVKAYDIEARIMPLLLRANQQYGFRGVFIEPKGHGIYLNQKLPQLNIVMQGEKAIDEFFNDRRFDKVTRANAVMPYLAYKKVHINREIPENVSRECVSEIISFPNGKHDDFVDCVVDALKYTQMQNVSILDVL